MCHLYHHHLWGEISDSISRIKTDKQVYVNLTNDKPYEQITKDIKARFPHAKILVSPNQGKDIGGNLRLIGQWMEDGSPGNIILLCHTKNKNDHWRRELLAPLFTNYIPYLFKNNSTIGMLGHKSWLYHRNDDINSVIYNDYCKRFGFQDTSMHFIAGTMFAVRSDIFKKFFSQFNATALANELEPGDIYEPSKTHAWERLYGGIVRHYNYFIKSIERGDDISNDILQSFNEKNYLESNPDVKKAVLANNFSSGLEHYVKHGIKENRIMKQGKNITYL